MTQESIEKVCFVIAPIGAEGSPERFHSNIVLEEIIKPATKECGYKAIRADEIAKPGIITQQVIKHVSEAPLVIANLTNQNPNVFYELALRHTLEKPVILIAPKGLIIPFDIAPSRAIFFDIEDKKSCENCHNEIVEQIHAIEESPENYDNPISIAIEVIESRANAQFTPEDVRKAFEKIPDLQVAFSQFDLRSVINSLRGHRIETKGQLNELLSTDVLETIRSLYLDELLRQKDKLLDPEGIAAWGSYFVYNDITERTKDIVRNKLRKSDEYRERHGDLIIFNAQYGVNVTWRDVTSIVTAKVQNNSLSLLVANDTFGHPDPLFGVRKRLKVLYSYKGQEQTKEIEEDDILRLP